MRVVGILWRLIKARRRLTGKLEHQHVGNCERCDTTWYSVKGAPRLLVCPRCRGPIQERQEKAS